MVPPWAVVKVPAVTERAGPSTSVSLACRLMAEVKGTSSVVLTASSTASGASFAPLMVTVSVAVALSPSLSVIW